MLKIKGPGETLVKHEEKMHLFYFEVSVFIFFVTVLHWVGLPNQFHCQSVSALS